MHSVPQRIWHRQQGLLFVLVATAGWAQPAPDVIYYNASIITMWASSPAAQAVAIRGDRFVSVGSNAEVLQTAGPATRKIDLAGKCMLPGIIETHVHPISAALSEIDGAVPVIASIAALQTYIREQAAKLPRDRLIFVPKVYSTRLTDRRYPTRYELDSAAPNREVMADNGYASVLNSALLKRLNITRDTPQPENGRIVKDPKGEPTGLILGASQLLGKLRGSRPYTDKDRLWALENMLKRYNSVGITSIIDRGEGPDGFRTYQTLRDKGLLTARAYVTYMVQARGTPAQVRQEIERIPFFTGWGDNWVRAGSLKTVIDGGILIGTAFLREPYGPNTQIYGYVDPDYRGVLSVPRENVVAMAKAAAELGWQMTSHTTGGGATDVLLDAYEAANKVTPLAGRR